MCGEPVPRIQGARPPIAISTIPDGYGRGWAINMVFVGGDMPDIAALKREPGHDGR